MSKQSKDYCTLFPDTWIAWDKKTIFKKINISKCCELHDKGCSSTKFFKCLVNKNVVGAWIITLGGALGCLVKYPIHTIKRVFGKTKQFKGENVNTDEEIRLFGRRSNIDEEMGKTVSEAIKEIEKDNKSIDYDKQIKELREKIEKCKKDKNATNIDVSIIGALASMLTVMIDTYQTTDKIKKSQSSHFLTVIVFVFITSFMFGVIASENRESIKENVTPYVEEAKKFADDTGLSKLITKDKGVGE